MATTNPHRLFFRLRARTCQLELGVTLTRLQIIKKVSLSHLYKHKTEICKDLQNIDKHERVQKIRIVISKSKSVVNCHVSVNREMCVTSAVTNDTFITEAGMSPPCNYACINTVLVMAITLWQWLLQILTYVCQMWE